MRSDVTALTGLVAATEQQDQSRSVLQVVDPVALAMVDPQFLNPTTDRLHIAGVARGEAIDPHQHTSSGPPILSLRTQRSKVALLTTSTMCQLWFTVLGPPNGVSHRTSPKP